MLAGFFFVFVRFSLYSFQSMQQGHVCMCVVNIFDEEEVYDKIISTRFFISTYEELSSIIIDS